MAVGGGGLITYEQTAVRLCKWKPQGGEMHHASAFRAGHECLCVCNAHVQMDVQVWVKSLVLRNRDTWSEPRCFWPESAALARVRPNVQPGPHPAPDARLSRAPSGESTCVRHMGQQGLVPRAACLERAAASSPGGRSQASRVCVICTYPERCKVRQLERGPRGWGAFPFLVCLFTGLLIRGGFRMWA